MFIGDYLRLIRNTMKKILTLAMCLFVFLSCEESIQTTVNTQIDNVQNESDILNIKTRATTLSQDQIFDVNTYLFSIEEDSLFIESLGWRVFNIVCDSLVYIVNGDMICYFLKRTCFCAVISLNLECLEESYILRPSICC